MRDRLDRRPDVEAGGLRRTFAAFGRAVFRVRDALVPVVVAVMLVTMQRADLLLGPRWDPALTLVGAVLLVVGTTIRLLVAASVDIRRSGKHRRIAAHRLVQRGLYAHTRNPLYLANVALVLGLACLYDSRWAWLAVVPVVLVAVWSMITAEEIFLAERFGAAYDRYRAAVPRFWPRLRGLAASLANCRLDWRRAARREHGTVFATVTTALAMIAANRVARYGVTSVATTIRTTATLWIACAAIYTFVRVLKKTGRLETPHSP